jgi:hypothetical protein
MNIKPSELSRDQWTYKGWEISFDMPPIPIRDFDWVAIAPEYDVDCDQDGYFDNGMKVHAATYEDLLVAIEDFIACEGSEA